MLLDVRRQRAQAAEDRAVVGIVRAQLETVALGHREREFERVDRVEAEVAAEQRGFRIDRFTCLGMTDDREMARISHDEIAAFAEEATAPQSDALFISCTAVRAAEVAPRIEKTIGKPVVSSNLATAWACLRLCGDATARPELGTLMTKPYLEG